LFLARSYESVGVNEICIAAKANKGGFYHHFPSKSDLAVAVLDRHATKLWSLMDQAERRRRGPVGRLRCSAEVVEGIQLELHDFFGRVVGCPLGNLAIELPTTDEPVGRHVGMILDHWERRIAGHCHDVAQAGKLRPGTEPDRLAHEIMASMQGAVVLAKVSQSGPGAIPKAMSWTIEAALV
jgi:TetR/AcrR family transcriptional repressor of nem operon